MKKILFVFILFLVILAGGGIYTTLKSGRTTPGLKIQISQEPQAASEQDKIEEGVSQKVLAFNMEGYTKEGKKKWHLEGKSADILSEIVKLTDIMAVAYGEDASFTITAKEGIYNKESKNVNLGGDVIAKTTDGVSVSTASCSWESGSDEIKSEGPIQIIKDDLKTEGKGAVANLKSKQMQINEDVKVELAKGATVITCDGPLEIDYLENKAVFKNDVAVKDTRGEVYADNMTVLLNPEQKQVNQIIAEGDVRIVRDKNTTYSQKAVYDVASGKVTLTGTPKLVIYDKGQIEQEFMKQ